MQCLLPGNADFSLRIFREIYENAALTLTLSQGAEHQITQSAVFLEHWIHSFGQHQKLYGVNTGVGLLAQESIPRDQWDLFQKNIILSHARGVGDFLPEKIVRLILALKIHGLSQGYSGVRLELIQYLIAFYNHRLYPQIPEKGSVGASGDLAPLAHLALPLLGIGYFECEGRILSAREGLKTMDLPPFTLGPKEGLALVNGTQVSTALALSALFKAESVFSAAILAGCLSLIACQGNPQSFSPLVQAVRKQKGQIQVSEVYRHLLQGYDYHAEKSKTQDRYALRCQPQVMGACFDILVNASDIFWREANSVTDNPLIFCEEQQILTGGNFHGEPIAFAADHLALMIAEMGSLSERRINGLLQASPGKASNFLIQHAGIHSGFMISHVTASALVSENKSLAHPASVDSIETSGGQEDHVSMSTFAARRLHDMLDNTSMIVAIELATACQALDLDECLVLPMTLDSVKQSVRSLIPYLTHDEYIAPEINALQKKILHGDFVQWIQPQILPSYA